MPSRFLPFKSRYQCVVVVVFLIAVPTGDTLTNTIKIREDEKVGCMDSQSCRKCKSPLFLPSRWVFRKGYVHRERHCGQQANLYLKRWLHQGLRGSIWKTEVASVSFLFYVISPIICRFRMLSLPQTFSRHWFEQDIIDPFLSLLQVLVC